MTWLELLTEVRVEFAEAAKIQEELEGLKAMLEAAKELERVTKERVEAGKLPQAFLFGATADRLRVEREVVQMDAELQGAIARIAACCGVDVTGNRVGEWDVPMNAPQSYAEAEQLAYRNAPEVAMLEQEAQAWALRERYARQTGLPTVSLVASGDRVFANPDMGRQGSQMGLWLSWPFGVGGMRRAEAEEAKKRKLQAEASVAVAKNQIRADITDAWARWTASAKVLESATAQIEAAQEAYRIAKVRYEEGKAIRAEVAQALADLLAANTALAEARRYQRQAWSRLTRPLGGSLQSPQPELKGVRDER
jgi:outer membrane protein TolC